MKRHGAERTDFPGTGGELARHLLDDAGLQEVKVEIANGTGDHYSPVDRAVRLSKANHDGRSVTAVAVAAHEVGHALQHAQGFAPLLWRQRLVGYTIVIERIGSVLLLASPLVFMLVRSPLVLIAELTAAFAILAATVVIHLFTLPTELDASYRRALPILGNYLKAADLPAARRVLTAAAFTYVAAALMSLLDVARWVRVLRL
jgi:Zn-dependent membrane protease YugP